MHSGTLGSLIDAFKAEQPSKRFALVGSSSYGLADVGTDRAEHAIGGRPERTHQGPFVP